MKIMNAPPCVTGPGWKSFGEFLLWIPFIALGTVVTVGALLAGLSYWSESTNRQASEKITTVVVTAYHEAAARGDVPAPAAVPDALLAGGHCFGPPYIVLVKTDSGEKRRYLAEGHPSTSLKAESWTFRWLGSQDPQPSRNAQ